MYHCGCKSKIEILGSKIKMILNFKVNCYLIKKTKEKQRNVKYEKNIE